MFSLILPTYNEAENLPELIPEIEEILKNIPHEIIVVDDDSPDKTWEVGQKISETYPTVRVIRRIGRKGLSSAVIEGFLAAKGSVLGVMDADGQHDQYTLPQLYKKVQEDAGIALGSRYIEGGSVGNWDSTRQWISSLGTKLALWLCNVRVSDPMSGFFAVDRHLFNSVVESLNPKGFKILLDILVQAPKNTNVAEVPFTFGLREHGESKLSGLVQLQFLEYLYDVTAGRYVPLHFIKFCIVGSLGLLVHMSIYWLVADWLSGGEELKVHNFRLSVIIATEVAILFNYTLNNLWTFRDQKLTGRSALWGLVTFNGACLFGAVANFGVSTYLFARGIPDSVSVLIGALAGTFWNYASNRMITWRK